jgi:hypothetical protein
MRQHHLVHTQGIAMLADVRRPPRRIGAITEPGIDMIRDAAVLAPHEGAMPIRIEGEALLDEDGIGHRQYVRQAGVFGLKFAENHRQGLGIRRGQGRLGEVGHRGLDYRPVHVLCYTTHR